MLHRTRNRRGARSRRGWQLLGAGSALGAFALGGAPVHADGGRAAAHQVAGVALAEPPSPVMAALAADYYREEAAAHPGAYTAVGVHEHDGDLEQFALTAQAEEVARLRGWQTRLAQVPRETLSRDDQIDLELLEHSVAGQLLVLIEVQPLRRWPSVALDVVTNGVYVIIKREYAPAADRLRAVIAREKLIPARLATALTLLDRASREATETALREVPDIRSFFKNDVPAAFADVHDAALLEELKSAGQDIDAALAHYEHTLKSQVLPRAKAPIALGEPLYRRLLANQEWETTAIPPLLAKGEAELLRLRKAFIATAQTIDPQHTPAEVLAAIHADHAPASGVLEETRARLAGLRQFIVAHDLMSIPDDGQPIVQESPPFMRATTLASMESPGVLETKSTKAFYNITLPDPAWTPKKADDYLGSALNRRLLDVTTIHEVFPGHYLQDLWQRREPSLVRRIEGANTFIEGWAHYCEQMTLDEGYGDGDAKLRLSQTQDALLRAARFVVAVRMHTRGMTFAQAVAFFQKEGLQSAPVAEAESRRAVSDALYLYYTLGKLEILQLREEYRAKLGAQFTLRKFHDAMLAAGALPIPLLRKVLLAP